MLIPLCFLLVSVCGLSKLLKLWKAFRQKSTETQGKLLEVGWTEVSITVEAEIGGTR